MKKDEKCQGIIRHPYIERQGKHFLLVKNATVKDANALICLLNIAENMCTCSNREFEKLIPVFKEFYSMIGDADKEIKFIKEQRKEVG